MPKTPRRKVQDTREHSDAFVDRSEWAKEYYIKNKDRIIEYRKNYHIKNRDKILKRVRKHYEENREKRLAYGKQWRDSNPEKMTLYRRRHVVKLKSETFDAYGGRICNCCGEEEPLFLSIDHINNNGADHRREIGSGGGKGFYTWLRKNNYPEGYQVLCFNCNVAKGHFGTCPHQMPENTIAPL